MEEGSEIQRKLRAAIEAWEPERTLSRQDRDATLRRRARELARDKAAVADTRGSEFVVFSLGDEPYAVESRFVREVSALKELTPIPCTPDFVLGVINVRAAIWPVIDLRPLLGIARRNVPAAARALIIGDGAMEFAILAELVLGVRSIASEEVAPAPAMGRELTLPFLQGIAADRTVILDVPRLLACRELVVNEHVE